MVVTTSHSPNTDASSPAPTRLPSVSIIVPTYKEAENLPGLMQRIGAVIDEHQLDAEVLVMDDDSPDGTPQVVAELNKPWLKLVVRKENRGLSPSVLDGFHAAGNDILLCMDADLSHPPEKIPQLMQTLVDGADFVIGSRYVKGGSTDAEWGVFRWLNSKVATLFAKPFTDSKDPMAGFFAMKRRTFEAGENFNPIGYKIGLELLVKCRCRDVREVPIHFADRQLGESKLNFAEQVRYLEHVRRLYTCRFPVRSMLLQFLVIGFFGTVVNLAAFGAVHELGAAFAPALVVGIALSLITNVAVIRFFNLSGGRAGPIARRFAFVLAQRGPGAVVNFLVAIAFMRGNPDTSPYIAALVGVLAGLPVNLLIHGVVGWYRRRVAAARDGRSSDVAS